MPRLEHVGFAVSDLDTTLDALRRVLELVPYKTETVAREGVRTHFLDAGAKLELLEAIAPESPVAAFLAKKGPGLHHLAFDVDDLDATFARLSGAGVPLLADAPKAGADGKRIFFVHPKATPGLLVEFCADDPSAMPTPAFVPFEGGQIATYALGSDARPTLVLLHGAGGSTQLETLPLARQLQTDFRVVAFDLPGHGQSADDGRAPITFERMQAATLAVLDAAGGERAVLAGYSFGGAIALFVSAQHPARVERVAAHATNVFWDEAMVRGMAKRVNVEAIRRRPDVWTMLDHAHGGHAAALFPRVADFSATIPAFRAEAERLLPQVTAPVLLTAGDRDDLFPLDATLRLRDALPNASLGLVPGLRHRLDPAGARAVAAMWKAWLVGG
ncbi:MAG: alpha/beta fold hydrolase [Bacteroidetes bacterium]|nr:alpha/beta fold hydrolase [Bacteroidota bacterium]